MIAARPYARALADVISSLYSKDLEGDFPLLRQPKTVKKAAVVLLTSNRGMAGGFNANLIKEARTLIKTLESAGTAVELHVSGKKGIGYFRYIGRAMVTQRTDIGEQAVGRGCCIARRRAHDAVSRKSEIDALYVVCASYKSRHSASPPPVSRACVARARRPQNQRAARDTDFLLFPDAGAILSELLPAYVRNAMYKALVETVAAEHVARRTAMKAATDNGGEILNLLRRTYNRARQANITQEIAEIVGGAAALE